MDAYTQLLADKPNEVGRFRQMLDFLSDWTHLFEGCRCLDFGCSWGTSAVAIYHLGAHSVVGVDPDKVRIDRGKSMMRRIDLEDRVKLRHLEDTKQLPFDHSEFGFVLAQGVLEHIPQPRDRHLREMWRVIRARGHLMVGETPNKYWPRERHTTGLWFNHWLPSRLARWRARRVLPTGWSGILEPKTWRKSGWRGLGYYEMVESLKGYTLIPECKSLRHRVLSFLRLPASLIDPYPIWVLRKEA